METPTVTGDITPEVIGYLAMDLRVTRYQLVEVLKRQVGDDEAERIMEAASNTARQDLVAWIETMRAQYRAPA